MEIKTDITTYYGKLDKPLKGDNVSYLCVHEAFNRILDKNNKQLEVDQSKLLVKLKQDYFATVVELQNRCRELNIRVNHLEAVIDRLDKSQKDR